MTTEKTDVANLKTELESMLDTDERIEAVVIGRHDSDENRFLDSEAARHPDKINRILTWAEAAPILDEEYDCGYGGADCWPFYAWTNTHVYFVHEYDGSTGIQCIPRNPVNCEPDFSG